MPLLPGFWLDSTRKGHYSKMGKAEEKEKPYTQGTSGGKHLGIGTCLRHLLRITPLFNAVPTLTFFLNGAFPGPPSPNLSTVL